MREVNMKVGARNRIIGEVKSISKGQVMCLVKVAIPEPSNMASVMTLESLEEMQLKKGQSRGNCEGSACAISQTLNSSWTRWERCFGVVLLWRPTAYERFLKRNLCSQSLLRLRSLFGHSPENKKRAGLASALFEIVDRFLSSSSLTGKEDSIVLVSD